MTHLPAIRYPKPPAQVAPYVEAIGYTKTIELLLNFGGASLYIPERSTSNSQLAKVVGPDGIVALSAIRERLPVRVPLASPWLSRCFKARGYSVSETARRLRVTDATVRKYLKSERGDYGEKL